MRAAARTVAVLAALYGVLWWLVWFALPEPAPRPRVVWVRADVGGRGWADLRQGPGGESVEGWIAAPDQDAVSLDAGALVLRREASLVSLLRALARPQRTRDTDDPWVMTCSRRGDRGAARWVRFGHDDAEIISCPERSPFLDD